MHAAQGDTHGAREIQEAHTTSISPRREGMPGLVTPPADSAEEKSSEDEEAVQQNAADASSADERLPVAEDIWFHHDGAYVLHKRQPGQALWHAACK